MAMIVGLVIVGAVVLVLALLERTEFFRFQPMPALRPGFLTDVVYLATGFVLLPFAEARLLGSGGAGLPVPLLPVGELLPGWIVLLGAFVLMDLVNYLAHLFLHEVDALWEFHKIHHSNRSLDWIAGFRAHLGEQLLRQAAVAVLVVLLFTPDTIAITGAFVTAWTVFVHSNLRVELRWLEPVLVTPRLHRLHHVPETTQRNLAGALTWWDRLRGTLVDGRVAPGTELGVPNETDTYPQGWLRQLWEPVARVLGGAWPHGYPSS